MRHIQRRSYKVVASKRQLVTDVLRFTVTATSKLEAEQEAAGLLRRQFPGRAYKIIKIKEV